MGFGGLETVVEPESYTDAVGASLFERTKKFLGVPRWEAAAFVLERSLSDMFSKRLALVRE